MSLSQRSYSIKPSKINKSWHVIDATNLVLGRLSSKIAILIRGKHKTTYTPHMDCGDKVIVVNAKNIYLSGKKLLKGGKLYFRHTGYPGGIKQTSAKEIKISKYPERILKLAIKNMLPKNTLSQKQLKNNLYLYSGNSHPHEAQMPNVYDFAGQNPKNIRR